MSKEVRNYTVQTIDEFTADEQKKILDKYRDINVDYNWWDDYEYTEKLGYMGFTDARIYFDLFGQGCGASFTSGLDFNVLLADLDIKHKDFWIAYLDDQGMKIKDIPPYGDMHKYSKYIDTEGCVLDYRGADQDWPHLSKEFDRIMKHLEDKRLEACGWLYRVLDDTYESLESDEAVRETIEANEYMFDTRTLEIA